MTPRVKHQVGITMLHIYRGIVLLMLSYVTFTAREFYVAIRATMTDVDKLKEDRREHEQKHFAYDADVRELKSRVNYLYEHKDPQ